MKVNIMEAGNQLPQLVELARAGQEVLIANHGVPVARLVAAESVEPISTAPAEGLVGWLTRHPLPAAARRSEREIDAAIAGERAGWD